MSHAKDPMPQRRSDAPMTRPEAPSKMPLRPDRHAAITNELFTYKRYKAWEEKIRREAREVK